MKNLNASARGVDSGSIAEHRFPWRWYLSDLSKVPSNGKTVFSCFSCGGGSSMGYKLAGYDVVGNVEIDPRVMEVYKKNLHPKHPFLMDVRDFLKIPNEELPEKLFHLDILDGSPPCSVFSMVGKRETGWNKEKVFREGQAKQKLDDLFFYFIQIAEKLKPRVVIAENVSGLLKGNAKGYVNEIFKAFDGAGYKAQLFLLNAAFMGVPQKRERCFFIAQRKDQGFPKLELKFDENPILFGNVREPTGKSIDPEKAKDTWTCMQYVKPGDDCLADIKRRIYGKPNTGFSNIINQDYSIAHTLCSNGLMLRAVDKSWMTEGDKRNIATFPQDYDFGDQTAQYVCGMSVPPVMMAQVASEVYEQWFKGDD